MNNLAIFVDLDGTCTNVGDRFINNPPPANKVRGNPEYEAWLKEVQSTKLLMQDHPVSGMRELILSLKSSPNVAIFYLTSRGEELREDTKKWLSLNGFPLDIKLLMRPENNKESSAVLKRNEIKELVENYFTSDMITIYNNIIVIDDDPKGELQQECALNGWTFLRACSGGIVL